MKKTIASSIAIMALGLGFGCGDDGDTSGGMPDAGTMPGDPPDAGDPTAFPVLGAQLDRSGRPAISTALIASMLHADQAARDQTRTDYSTDDDPASWVATWQAEIHAHVAVLDGLDSSAVTSGCGNSFAFDGGGESDYDFLAATLADDRLLVDPQATSCTQYLAVEAGASGADECGGRTPVMDVIETSYSALSIGALAGIDDGVAADDATHNADTFPFLAPPGAAP